MAATPPTTNTGKTVDPGVQSSPVRRMPRRNPVPLATKYSGSDHRTMRESPLSPSTQKPCSRPPPTIRGIEATAQASTRPCGAEAACAVPAPGMPHDPTKPAARPSAADRCAAALRLLFLRHQRVSGSMRLMSAVPPSGPDRPPPSGPGAFPLFPSARGGAETSVRRGDHDARPSGAARASGFGRAVERPWNPRGSGGGGNSFAPLSYRREWSILTEETTMRTSTFLVGAAVAVLALVGCADEAAES